ncbi:MAG: hypothetical protein JJE39_15300 [Vicinamibacteria bacterium]|nr:hypothetical protein [Vicinamibacteria bacterium]
MDSTFGPAIMVTAALLFLFVLLLDIAGRFRQPIVVDIGPSTGRYGSGFEDSEETPPTTSRWTRQNAEFDIPLSVDASVGRFSVRAARYLDDPTPITVTLNGKLVAGFEQARGRQRIQAVEVPLPGGRLNLGITSQDPNLGMALDWIRLDGVRWHVPADEWTVWILPVGLFAALVLSGASVGVAGGATAAVLGILAVIAAVDPFGFVHLMRDVGVPAVVFSLLSALLFRGQTGVLLAITATVLLKGGFLFHPSYFYNDVRQNDRYVGALRSYEGGLLERSTQAQIDLGVGYPRIIGGKKYAFPYSPLFFWPFTALPSDRDMVVRALKHIAVLGAALEVALAFLLARKILPAAGPAAAWLTLAFPIITSRMLFAMWATVAAHGLDLLVILLAVRVIEEPKDRRAWLRLFAAVIATLLTYVSSLFTMSAFLLALALLSSKIRWRVIGLWFVAILGVVVVLYRGFTITFLTEIMPMLVTGSGRMATAPSADTGSLFAAFSRIVLFTGFGFPCFAFAGLVLILKRRDPGATVLRAYAMAFLSLVVLRGLSGGLFKDLKEVEFGGPAMTILGAVALDRIGPSLARGLILVGLVAAGIWMQYGHFEEWSRLVLG